MPTFQRQLPVDERGVAPPQGGFHPLALGQVEHECDVLVPTAAAKKANAAIRG